ncbi:MAG: membrane protein insertase YidC [Amphiplicatus sp.]
MDRNFILAIALSLAVFLIWDFTVMAPQRAAQQAAREAASESAAAEEKTAAPDLGGLIGGGAPPVSVEAALAEAPGRVAIDTPSLQGSINLAGARIDDLSLKNYRETLDPASPMIRLLSPANTEHGHYVQQGWGTASGGGENALWSAPEGARLTPATPVTLTRREGGLVFEKTFSVDEQFMFTVSQTVRNEGAAPATIEPYGLVIQRGIPTGAGRYAILHEGPIGVVGDSLLERKYKKMAKGAGLPGLSGDRGWVGVTNKYWLAAAIPPQGAAFTVLIRNAGTAAAPVFQSSYKLEPITIAPNDSAALTSYVFGGAKDVDILRGYERPVEKGGLGIWDFDRAVDWGNFWFLTRPIFWTLDFFGDHIGNFGVAILILTLIIKALLFPLANKAYESMSKMKKLQPEIKKLQERYADDKMKLQQEMMALYKKEKMNPLAGCVPILIQMPIFYALYKTLFVTIELRHEPFILWIKDLSAPDPTTVFNLFGLIPYDPTAIPVIGAFLGVGVLPLLMGCAMWLQTKLNPPPADPMQAQIFGMMPIIFTFLFASFASGLVLYWFWNTSLSIAQQYIIMKRNGVEVNLMENLKLPWATKKKITASAGTSDK